MPETEQETGRKGVKRIQRLLEATARFNLPYDAYQHPARVTLKTLTGRTKTYDLTGDFLDRHGQALRPIYIESKNVADAGGQAAEFEEFLVRAYSATRQRVDDVKLDPEWEFMWATTCPWKGDGFRDVASRASLERAVEDGVGGPFIPDDHAIDGELLEVVADRLWVWVVSDRQEDMTISERMQGWIAQKIKEGGEEE